MENKEVKTEVQESGKELMKIIRSKKYGFYKKCEAGEKLLQMKDLNKRELKTIINCNDIAVWIRCEACERLLSSKKYTMKDLEDIVIAFDGIHDAGEYIDYAFKKLMEQEKSARDRSMNRIYHQTRVMSTHALAVLEEWDNDFAKVMRERLDEGYDG